MSLVNVLRFYLHRLIPLAVLCLMICGCGRDKSNRLAYRTVAPGLEYAEGTIELTRPVPAVERTYSVRVTLLRADLKAWEPRLVRARDHGFTAMELESLAQSAKAVGLVNGGYFLDYTDYAPTGLRILAGKPLSPLGDSAHGILVIKSDTVKMIAGKDLPHEKGVLTALENSPRLVINGNAQSGLRDQTALRTVVGLDRENRIYLLITSNAGALELAGYLARPTEQGGLGLREALNLDGGPSSGLYLHTNGFQRYFPSLGPVPEGLALFPRTDSGARR